MLLSVFITPSAYHCPHIVEGLLLHPLYCFMGHLKFFSRSLLLALFGDRTVARLTIPITFGKMISGWEPQVHDALGVSWHGLPDSCHHWSGAAPLAMCTNCWVLKIEYKSTVF